MFYLPSEHWSPRFEPTFFTVTIVSKASMTSCPSNTVQFNELGGNKYHPAVYYNVEVRCAHHIRMYPRRFSQFRQLYERLCNSPHEMPLDASVAEGYHNEPIYMPPGTCCLFLLNEEFLENRKDDLNDFLREILRRPGCAQHPAMIHFLELEYFLNKSDEE